MMKFDTYLNQEQIDMENIIELYQFINKDMLNEGMDFQGILNKLGFKVSKGKGIIQILAGASVNVSKIVWYTFKLYQGDEEYRQKILDIYSKVKKEDVMDFLLKLDMLTLHTLTGPIHMLDAITGWHLSPNINKVTKDISYRINRVIKHLTTVKDQEPAGVISSTIDKMVNQLKGLFGVS